VSKRITFQKIFDAAWQAFIVEDKPPSVNADGNCVYDDGNGNCCAIGLVLPEGHPSRSFLGGFNSLIGSYSNLFANDILRAGFFTREGIQRRLHDRLISGGVWAYSKEERKRKYIEVAKEYNLKVPGENND